MRRFALFVEGATEASFCERLIAEIAGHNNALIVHQRTLGKGRYSKIRESIFTSTSDHRVQFYFLIFNCGSDDTVLSAMLERLPDLARAGYRVVVGLRDLYPRPPVELETIRARIATALSKAPIPARVTIAVREIEAWFLAETDHFQRIDASLTTAAIRNSLGIDVHREDFEAIPHPTQVLRAIYGIAGKRYLKGEHKSRQTVDALDYENLYLVCRHRLPSLDGLCGELDEMLT